MLRFPPLCHGGWWYCSQEPRERSKTRREHGKNNLGSSKVEEGREESARFCEREVTEVWGAQHSRHQRRGELQERKNWARVPQPAERWGRPRTKTRSLAGTVRKFFGRSFHKMVNVEGKLKSAGDGSVMSGGNTRVYVQGQSIWLDCSFNSRVIF